jgi:hypothetical protein
MDNGFRSPKSPQCPLYIDDPPTALQVEKQTPVPPHRQQPPQLNPGRPSAPENTDHRALVPMGLRRPQAHDRSPSKRSPPPLYSEYVPKPYKYPRIDERQLSPPLMRRPTALSPPHRHYPDDQPSIPHYSEGNAHSEGAEYLDSPDRPDVYYRIDDMVDQLPENKVWALLEFLENAKENDWAALGRPARREGKMTDTGRYNHMGVMLNDVSGVTININNSSNGGM